MKIILLTLSLITTITQGQILSQVEHSYVDNNGVKIHYVSLGEGPLVVMIHGFPDFWYTWRYQMQGLADRFRMVAIDLRGYNRSDKPSGVDQYAMPLLVSDIVAVIRQLAVEVNISPKAVIVGHDWGGAVAWSVAMAHPDLVKRLVICNLPHLKGLQRELAQNPQQQRNSQYARDFQQPDAHLDLTAEELAGWVADPGDKQQYISAFQRSDFEAMLNYYKANYPRPPSQYDENSPVVKVKCSVLMFHG